MNITREQAQKVYNTLGGCEFTAVKGGYTSKPHYMLNPNHPAINSLLKRFKTSIKTIWLAVFLNTAPTASNPKWCLVGDAKRDVLYNPRTGKMSYAPKVAKAISQKYAGIFTKPLFAIAGDNVFDFVDAINIPCHTQCILVFLHCKDTTYNAERIDCIVTRGKYREKKQKLSLQLRLMDRQLKSGHLTRQRKNFIGGRFLCGLSAPLSRARGICPNINNNIYNK